jgi:hypothetical protein
MRYKYLMCINKKIVFKILFLALFENGFDIVI